VAERDTSRSWLAGLGIAVAVVISVSVVVVARRQSDPAATPVTGGAAVEMTTSSSSVALAPDVTEAILPATTATTAPIAPSAPTTTRPAAADRTSSFKGMGAWVDVFEWAPSYSGTAVTLSPTAVDRMAAEGVQVLYLQATRYNNPTGGDIVDPDVLGQWLARAKAHGIRVVAWYMPTFTDPVADLRRLKAVAGLPDVAGIGVNIESTAVADPAVRSARMVELSRAVRAALPTRPLSAIVLPPVDTDVVNLTYWPGFPWPQIRGIYDVWQPMGYWTNRTASSGYRNAERYTRENVERLRAHLGDPGAVVHPIGGIMNKATPADVSGYLKAVHDTGSIGASLYNWSTQKPETYALMRAART